MFESAIEVLKKVEEKGFKAYIVGGYVRDMYLSRISNDIDICTSARPKDLLKIFNKDADIEEKYGSVKLKYDNYYFDITTFRKDFMYDDNRRPLKIEYVDSLKEDLLRRDFTINTLCIDDKKNIVDILNAKKDLDNKIIKTIRDANETIKEDSLRILRAIRFATVLNFKIDIELEKAIKKNTLLLNNLSFNRKKSELDLIFSSDDYKYGITLLEKFNLGKELEISNLNNLKRTTNILGMWAQIEFSDNYPFTKEEKNFIKKIRELILYGKIDSYVLYKYGIDLCIILGEILGLEKKYIIDLNNNLIIKSKEDINITVLEIIKLLNIDPSNKIKYIINDIEHKIINGELDNDRKKIEEYLANNY